LDREEFFRLKKVQNKKQRDTAAQDAEIRKKQEAAAKAGSDKENASGNADILGDQEDADVIF
jgi:V-type H+-transporting ATPase subunit D